MGLEALRGDDERDTLPQDRPNAHQEHDRRLEPRDIENCDVGGVQPSDGRTEGAAMLDVSLMPLHSTRMSEGVSACSSARPSAPACAFSTFLTNPPTEPGWAEVDSTTKQCSLAEESATACGRVTGFGVEKS